MDARRKRLGAGAAQVLGAIWSAAGSGSVAGLLFGYGLGLVEVGLQIQAVRPGRRFDFEIPAYTLAIDGFLGMLAGTLLAGLAVGLVRLSGRRPRPEALAGWATVLAAGLFPLAAGLLSSRVTIGTAAPTLLAGVGVLLAPVAYHLVRRLARRQAWRRIGFTALGALGLLIAADLALTFAGPIRAGGPLSAAASGATAAGAAAPNVLLITIDTLRADKIGAYGNTQVRTPTLDRLAREGVRFADAFVQQPQTNTSHTSLLTGTYPQTHGVRVHMVDRLGGSIPTMAELLVERGYATAGIYSWVSLDPAFSGLQRGFQTYEGFVVNQSPFFADPRLQVITATYRRLKEYVLVARLTDRVVQAADKYEEEMDGKADVTTDGAIDWLSTQMRAPFFLWVHYYDPHYPYTPPAPFNQMYDDGYDGLADGSVRLLHDWIDGRVTLGWGDTRHLEALYDGEVTFTDQQVGRLLQYLERRGDLDSTLVVVTADHGEMFGENDEWLHALSLRSGATRVPLIMRYPGHIPAETVVTAMAESVDVMPTILDLVGLPVPSTVDGQSLREQVLAPTEVDRYAHMILGDDSARSIVDQTWRLIEADPYGRRVLFHRPDDPREEHDVATSYPEVADRLGTLLDDWLRARRRG